MNLRRADSSRLSGEIPPFISPKIQAFSEWAAGQARPGQENGHSHPQHPRSRARKWGRRCLQEALWKFLTFFGLCLWALRWRSMFDSADSTRSLLCIPEEEPSREGKEFGGSFLISRTTCVIGRGGGGGAGSLVFFCSFFAAFPSLRFHPSPKSSVM